MKIASILTLVLLVSNVGCASYTSTRNRVPPQPGNYWGDTESQKMAIRAVNLVEEAHPGVTFTSDDVIEVRIINDRK